jgi:ribosomal protein S27E
MYKYSMCLLEGTLPTTATLRRVRGCFVRINFICFYGQHYYFIFNAQFRLSLIFISLIFISPCIFNIFTKCNQKDATFPNLFISIKCSICFRRLLRPSSGAQTVHRAPGICQTLLLTAVIMVGMELQFHPKVPSQP